MAWVKLAEWTESGGVLSYSDGTFCAAVFRGFGGFYFWVKRKHERTADVIHRGPMAQDEAKRKANIELRKRWNLLTAPAKPKEKP